ncbi:alpha/beta hydrolase [Phenylobacterium sp.]|uniref:alpha/beta fold hydrolase n=1 Tax=Phenylobacterium sp. TaxID=1871053 RepID=UPI002DF64139|nr:alpha/beta hydrolase [Phenylobacterium sp.]
MAKPSPEPRSADRSGGGGAKALLAAVGLVAGAFVVRGAIQRAGRAKAYLAEGIDEKIWISVGGIDQWVTIRGRNLDNPLLLVLHGGPGSALSVLAGKLFAGWDEHFTVVNWDQRGAGRTLQRNGKAGCGKLTIGRMVVDGIELAEDLRRRFPGRPLVVLGISWGSLLGVEMVRARPDLFAAYVGAGQVIDMARGEQLSYFGAIDRLRAKGEERSAQALEAIGPPPYPTLKALIKQRKLLISTMPKAERAVFRRAPLEMLLAPDAKLRDLVNFQAGARFSMDQLWDQVMGWRLADGGYGLEVPATLLQGDLDLQTPTALVTEAAAAMKAELVILEGAGHMALVTHGDEVLKALVKRARPAAVKKPRKKKAKT